MADTMKDDAVLWKSRPVLWALLLGIGALMGVAFFGALRWMVYIWDTSPEYGYGYMIPIITLFLIWQRKHELERIEFRGAWVGVFIALLGVVVLLLGMLSTIYVVAQYAFLIVLIGVLLSFVGWSGLRPMIVPILFLVFMIPLPVFLYNSVSASLQLISSQLGVAVIRLFDVPVFLQGNVIDLGVYKLQVAEACSGLRYLFPLASLSFIMAYFYDAPFWKRAVVVLSSAPITVLMNSLRIGVIGILVQYWGIKQAEGFLHAFEGWAVFMFCIALVVVEMWALSRIGGDNRPFHQIFRIHFPGPSEKGVDRKPRSIPLPLIVSGLVVLVAATAAPILNNRREIIPVRTSLTEFPMVIDGWKGTPNRLEQVYLRILKLTDYVIADYARPGHPPINFYIAYYDSQRSGDAAHSPRSCIPGGGWKIEKLQQRTIPGVTLDGRLLRVNRVLIRRGGNVQVVYYWFQERGRDLTNEYLVKWYLFWDALTRNRTDGSLVRLTAFVPPGGNPASADRELTAFLKDVVPLLPKYLPN